MPNEECIDCILRFERQALEWGESYRFQSCADIDVVTVSQKGIQFFVSELVILSQGLI